MKDRPILFSGSMIRALLAGEKTQTRRLVKGEIPPNAKDAGGVLCSDPAMPSHGTWHWLDDTDLMWASVVGETFRCPYGVPGDLLVVRETWGINHFQYCRPHPIPKSRPADLEDHQMVYFGSEDDCEILAEMPKTPAIHMPRWASRLTLWITDVRVQRLHDISEADAKAEGITFDKGLGMFRVPGTHDYCMTAAAAYQRLWALINGEESQAANPWSWAVSFEVHQQNVDAFRRDLEAA